MTESKKKKSFVIYPTYSDIFKNGQEEIIAQLSTEGLAEKYIVFTTSLSALLYVSHIKGMHVQEKIMIEFKDVICNTVDGHAVLDWLISNGLKTLNFNNFTLMELYCILLKHKKGECIDTSMSTYEKLTYLKLLFIANEKRLNKPDDFHNNLISITPDDRFSYEKMFWPLLLPETDVNEAVRIEYEMFRLKYFIEEIKRGYPDTTIIIDNFFRERGFDSFSSYASVLSIIFLDYITSYTNHQKLKSGIKESEQIHKLFAALVINDIEIDSYFQLKIHPVYYYNGAYYVLHWNYFLSQIFIGTFMALEKKLNEAGFKDIKKASGLIVENTLFKTVLTTSFSKYWQYALFDVDRDGKPDAMFKIGNNLFILELKDNLMSESVMESLDYKCIEDYINKTFIQSGKKKKAIKQLVSYINNYENNEYGNDGFSYNKGLNIYPIIIYTDYKYRVNGLNHFLSAKFNELINQEEIQQSTRQRVHPLTVIGLDSMFNLQHKFRDKRLKLADSIDNYHKYIKNSEKKYEDKGAEFFSLLYPSFDRYLPENRNVVMPYNEIQSILKDFFIIEDTDIGKKAIGGLGFD